MQEAFHYYGECVTGCSPDPANDPPKGVCGVKNGVPTKYVNYSCAKGAGATCIYDGECAFGKNECKKNEKEYAPVCATYFDSADGEVVTKTFPNKCHAGCQLPEAMVNGQCEFCETQCPPEAVEAKEFCDPATCITYPNLCVPKKCLEIPEGTLQKDACPADCGVDDDADGN